MDTKTHWEKIYGTKAPETVSWYRPHLETSLTLIERAARDKLASIIDVGGGESTLVDDLLVRGYQNLAVLDISQTAVDVTRKRLGLAADQVHWLVTMSPLRGSNAALTMCGTIVRCSTFSLPPSNALLMSATSPMPLGRVVT